MNVLFALVVAATTHGDVLVARSEGSGMPVSFNLDGRHIANSASFVPDDDGTITLDTDTGLVTYENLDSTLKTYTGNAFEFRNFVGVNPTQYLVQLTMDGMPLLEQGGPLTTPVVSADFDLATTAGVPMSVVSGSFTGSWAIIGPTETATGTWDVPFTMDASAMHGRLELSRGFDGRIFSFRARQLHDINFAGPIELFDGTVDGEPFHLTMESARFSAGYSSTIQAIPEPGSIAFFVVAIAACSSKWLLGKTA